jgi:hypothetical protein
VIRKCGYPGFSLLLTATLCPTDSGGPKGLMPVLKETGYQTPMILVDRGKDLRVKKTEPS